MVVRAAHLRFVGGDVEGAKLAMRSALGSVRDPRRRETAAWAYTEAARLFWATGDYAGADALLDRALLWVEDDPVALRERGRVALSQGRFERAVSALEAAWRRGRSVEAAWLLADAREATGDGDGAGVARALVEREGMRHDKLTLARFLAVRGEDAPRAVELVESLGPARGGVFVEDVRAWALYRAGRLDEARAASERALALGTQSAELLYHAGAILHASGEVDRGRALVRRALELNPHFDRIGAREARALNDPARSPRTKIPVRPSAPSGPGVSRGVHESATYPLAERLCDAVHGVPGRRRRACGGGTAPQQFLRDRCVEAVSTALRGGGVTLDEQRLSRCERAAEAAHDGCAWVTPITPPPPAACRGLLVGDRPLKAACRSSLECAGDRFCLGAGPNRQGACWSAVAVGGPCGGAFDSLAAALRDVDASKAHPACQGYCRMRKCAALAERGEACARDRRCREGLSCVDGACVQGELVVATEVASRSPRCAAAAPWARADL